MLIVRYRGGKTVGSPADGLHGRERSLDFGNRRSFAVLLGRAVRWARGSGERRRQDSAKRKHAEEALPARVTSIGRNAQPAFQGHEGSLFHAVARDVLEIKISAPRAVRIIRKPHGHPPGIKSMVAGMASPGSEACDGTHEVRYAVTVGTEAIGASASRTDHSGSRISAANASEEY